MSTGRAPEIPAALRALMVEIGPRWAQDIPGHARRMSEAFTAVLDDAPRPDLKVTREVAYGAHARQVFDIYAPPGATGKRPAVLFVHGGAFFDGQRDRSPRIYSNVLEYFAVRGLIGINVGYRLAGDATYPAASEDVGTVVAWVRGHADEIGADPDNIFIMGHSAGCAHTGSYVYDNRLHPAGGPGVRGHIVVSGRVRADTYPDNPNAQRVAGYYGSADMAVLDGLSPVSHVGADSVPTFIAWAEYENPLIDVHCAELAFRLGVAKRHTSPVLWLKGHNHISSIAHIGTADDALGAAILDFIADPR